MSNNENRLLDLLEKTFEQTKELNENDKRLSEKMEVVQKSIASIKTKLDNYDKRLTTLEKWKEKQIYICSSHREELNEKIDKNTNQNTSQQTWVNIIENIFTKVITAVIGGIIAYIYFSK